MLYLLRMSRSARQMALWHWRMSGRFTRREACDTRGHPRVAASNEILPDLFGRIADPAAHTHPDSTIGPRR